MTEPTEPARDDLPLDVGSEPDGATPLGPDELVDLITDFVATRRDLDVVEAENIARAVPIARDEARAGGPDVVLTYPFLFTLHRRMFGDVWKWAGTQRRRVTNIGVEPDQITTQTRQALDDATYWHEHETFSTDERAVRIHHRLVAIHPFPNGNGRCTRLLADLYLTSVEAPAFSWADARLDRDGRTRSIYIEALRAADRGEYAPLITFARATAT